MGVSHLLCIDPGKGTGLAHLVYSPDVPAWIDDYAIEEFDPYEMYCYVLDWLHRVKKGRPDDEVLVICEAWESRLNDFRADPNYSCQLIGAVRVACSQLGVTLRMQAPGYRTAIEEVLYRGSTYWRSGKDDDARQAIRHGLAYLQEEVRHRPTQEALHPRKQA